MLSRNGNSKYIIKFLTDIFGVHTFRWQRKWKIFRLIRRNEIEKNRKRKKNSQKN